MTSFRTSLAIGAAAVAIVAGGLAVAQMKPAGVVSVRLPDGSVEQIRYYGQVPPEVSLRQVQEEPAGFAPAADAFEAGAPFAGFDRLFADMDREAAAMMRQADAMQRTALQARTLGPHGLMQAGFGDLPAGVRSYSMVTTIEGGKTCTRTTEITGDGPGRAPKVLTRSAGDCRAAEAPTVPTPALAAPAPARASGLVQASYRGDSATLAGPRLVASTD